MTTRLRAVLFDYFETLVTRPLAVSNHGERLGCPAAFIEVWLAWGRTSDDHIHLLSRTC